MARTASRSAARLASWVVVVATLPGFAIPSAATVQPAGSDDQFLVLDDRATVEAGFRRTGDASWAHRRVSWAYGAELEYHDIENGLNRKHVRSARSGAPGSFLDDAGEQIASGVFADLGLRWTDRVRTQVGLRADYRLANPGGDLVPSSAATDDLILSPELGLILGPWRGSEVYASWSRSVEDNDAAEEDPTIRPVDPFTRSERAELGLRTTAFDRLEATVSLFRIELGSEPPNPGDSDTVESVSPNRRTGLLLASSFRPRPWLALDLAITLAEAENAGIEAISNRNTDVFEETIAAAVTVGSDVGWYGAVSRYHLRATPGIGVDRSRPASMSLLNGSIGYTRGNGLRITLDGLNLLDRSDASAELLLAREIDSIGGGVDLDDTDLEPAEGRAFQLRLDWSF